MAMQRRVMQRRMMQRRMMKGRGTRDEDIEDIFSGGEHRLSLSAVGLPARPVTGGTIPSAPEYTSLTPA